MHETVNNVLFTPEVLGPAHCRDEMIDVELFHLPFLTPPLLGVMQRESKAFSPANAPSDPSFQTVDALDDRYAYGGMLIH
jgi:hypothetical protein